MIPPGTADLNETVPYTVDTQMVFSPLAKEEARFAAVGTGLMDGNPSSSHADGSEGEVNPWQSASCTWSCRLHLCIVCIQRILYV